MSKIPIFLYKTLVVGVIVLLCSINVVSSTGDIPIRNHSFLKNQVEVSSSVGDNDTTPPITWHILYPPEPDGKNGWYTTYPDITICAKDLESGLKYILISFQGGSMQAYPGPCISFIYSTEDSSINIKYSAVDNAGNTAPLKSFTIYIDKYKPTINVDWDVKIKGLSWFVRFNCEARDSPSGIVRVEMYINDVLQFTNNDSGPTYEFIIRYSSIVKSCTFKFMAFDIAGHSAFTLINGSDIKTHPQFQSSSYQYSINMWFLRFFERFPSMEVLLRIMNLLR